MYFLYIYIFISGGLVGQHCIYFFFHGTMINYAFTSSLNYKWKIYIILNFLVSCHPCMPQLTTQLISAWHEMQKGGASQAAEGSADSAVTPKDKVTHFLILQMRVLLV